MIIVTGSVLANTATFDEILRMSTAHVLRSRTESGCLDHAVHRNIDEPLRLHFLERWTDLASLKAHFGLPESRSFGIELARLAAEPPTMTLYEASEVTPR